MKRMQNPLMPSIGSRAHRVLVELARHDQPVQEADLMASHGLDGLEPTKWRQGAYKSLRCDGLIVQEGTAWALTPLGRELMDEVEEEMVRGAAATEAAAVRLAMPPLPAPSREPVPFKPLSRQNIQRPIREGAYDYRDIPSRFSGSALEKEPS